MPKTQEWIKQKMAEESVIYWTEMKLTEEVKELKERMKKLEIDIAHLLRKANG